jgi:[ribosomal protein S5]-alanine N-acetyltransferase
VSKDLQMTIATAGPVITTPRLVLRAYERQDLDALHEYRRHPEWARYVRLPRQYTRALAAQDIEEYINLDPATHPFWAITHEGRAVGNIDAERESVHRAILGWGIAHHLWGRGLTTEAARAVVDWCFTHWDVGRVYATADARNTGSRRVMEKSGMRLEATLREHRRDYDGALADEVWYGILRNEWHPEDTLQRAGSLLGASSDPSPIHGRG